MSLSVGLVLLFIVLLILYLVRPTFSRWRNLQRDYAPFTFLEQSKIPFLGHLRHIKSPAQVFKLFDTLAKRSQQEGHGVFCLWIGMKPIIILCTGESLEGFINNPKQLVKSKDYRFLWPWLKTGLLTSNNEKWRGRRRLITPSFHNNQLLNSFMSIFHEQSQILANRFEELSLSSSKTHSLYSYISACTLDIIAEAATGTHSKAQLGDTKNDFVDATIRMSDIIAIRTRTPWFWNEFIFNQSSVGQDHKKALEILHKFSREVIQERLKAFNADEIDQDESDGNKKRLVFLDCLLNEMHKEKLTIDDIQEEVDTFMFEGHDTTAAALYFALYLVGSHPEVQEKIHQEIDSVFGDDVDRMCTIEDTQKLTYLDAVVKESLRILPSVPFIGRDVQEDIVIGGHTIRKGTVINIYIHGIHRDEKVFPNAGKFDPSRFEGSNEERSPYAYIPFSAGSRNCIGQRFASLEERVVLATLFRRFSFKSTQKVDDLKLTADVILRTNVPIEMEIKRRF